MDFGSLLHYSDNFFIMNICLDIGEQCKTLLMVQQILSMKEKKVNNRDFT